MTITVKTKLSDEQRGILIKSLDPQKIAMIYDEIVCYIVSAEADSNDKLIGELDRLEADYNIVNSEEIVHTFRPRVNADFKLVGNLDLFPLNFTPGF
jgi:hypothetical protein